MENFDNRCAKVPHHKHLYLQSLGEGVGYFLMMVRLRDLKGSGRTLCKDRNRCVLQ
jgi:hypothetical protein